MNSCACRQYEYGPLTCVSTKRRAGSQFSIRLCQPIGIAVQLQAIVDQRAFADLARRFPQDFEIQEGGSELLQISFVAEIGPDLFRRMRHPLLRDLFPGRSLEGSQEIGEGRVDGLEPVAKARGERPTRLDLRAFQYDSAHFAVEHLDRKRRSRSVLEDPQRPAQRFREYRDWSLRCGATPSRTPVACESSACRNNSNDVVDVDPAHPLLAAPEPARGGRPEQRQHLRQRAPLPGEDDTRPHDRYAHIRSPIRQRTKFRFPRLDHVGEKASSLRAVCV